MVEHGYFDINVSAIISKLKEHIKMERRPIWITWERQRRSAELAKYLDCEFFQLEYSGIMKFPLSIISTFIILLKKKPEIIFVQNPSMILAGISCLYKLISSTFLVVDRHSNFLFTKKRRSLLYVIIFNILNRFTIRLADITIITNAYLFNLVKKIGGNPFILPDKIPILKPNRKIKLKGTKNILLISSFHLDEPIEEVINSMNYIHEDKILLYITGNYNKLDIRIRNLAIKKSIIFTGFLSEQEFINMIYSTDAIMVLTKIDHCMLCGCHEAVSAEKPLITSNKLVLREYFSEAVFVENTNKEIAAGIAEICSNIEFYQNKMSRLKEKLEIRWHDQFDELLHLISKLHKNPKIRNRFGSIPKK